MSLDYKNYLINIYQREGLTIPRFFTKSVNVPNHDPFWISTVIVSNGSQFNGGLLNNPDEAEQSAALKALKSLGLINFNNIERYNQLINTNNEEVFLSKSKDAIFSNNEKIALILDVERYDNLLDHLPKNINNVDVILFVPKNSILVNKKYNRNETVIFTENSYDIHNWMQVYIGMLLGKNSYDYYLIATENNQANSLVNIIRSNIFNGRAENLTNSLSLIF